MTPKDPNDPFSKLSEEQQRLRDLVNPPAMRKMIEEQRRLLAPSVHPELREMIEQQTRFRDLIDPPALRATRHIFEAFRSREETFRSLISPNIARQMEFLRPTLTE
jgi:hypothetical protein